MMESPRFLKAVILKSLLIVFCIAGSEADYDYGHALDLTLRYFEAQRSGPLPPNQRVIWRGDSGLSDGQDDGVDLVGGYYDAGDNVKYQFPMAFTITMLSWSVIEYRSQLQKQAQLQHALEAIRWGTDYFIKAHPEPDVLWVGVGDGDSDHDCWQRPEDMTTPRQAYKIDVNNHGSDVAGETAAAMAAASIVFQSEDGPYSELLLTHARQLFTFADTYRGNYDSSIAEVSAFYPSGENNFGDELLWAALWLFEATNDEYYLDYACTNGPRLGGTTTFVLEFGWNSKHAGLQVLASKILLARRGGDHVDVLEAYQNQAEFFVCAAVDQSQGWIRIVRTLGGLFWTLRWNNVQSVTAAAFLVSVYGDYLIAHAPAQDRQLSCSGQVFEPSELLDTSKTQVDYILGSNPSKMSYMVGYGSSYPKFVHHRGASIPSIKSNPMFVGCKDGYRKWFNSPDANVNVIDGAVVGPNQDDFFDDSRSNFMTNEPTTYNSAPLVGLLARLASGTV